MSPPIVRGASRHFTYLELSCTIKGRGAPMFNASLGAQPFDLRVVQSNDLDTHVCAGQDN